MSTFFELDCGGETVTIEKTDDGDFIFHGWDEETELAAIELGFEPSLCLIAWNAINEDRINDELFRQSRIGDSVAIQALLFVGASVDAGNIYTLSPLRYAAANGHADVVKILLDAGASVDTKTRTRWTPLHYAAMWGHTDIA